MVYADELEAAIVGRAKGVSAEDAAEAFHREIGMPTDRRQRARRMQAMAGAMGGESVPVRAG